ncbi:MAG: protoheme IX farnesyltransferase [Magnetococcales bacterium]|nr:protoheme IX farnesyltransferase [Magnetococcales bacterium]
MTAKRYIELLKLRIGGMITLTALVSYLAMAEQVSLAHIAMLILVMMLGSASSAVFNHFYDRDIDRKMERTSTRPLATKEMGNPYNALWLAGGLIITGVGIASWYFNPIVGLHLFLGAFVYGIVYTVWLKRRHWVNIIIGGAAGSFAVLAGAASVCPELCVLPLLLAVVLFLWTPSHFWALAIFLKEEYRKVGVPMLPVVVGEQRAANWVLVNSILLVGSSLVPWYLGELGVIYGIGALIAGVLLLAGNWKMVQTPTRQEAWKNFIGSMRYLGILFLFLVIDAQTPEDFLNYLF